MKSPCCTRTMQLELGLNCVVDGGRAGHGVSPLYAHYVARTWSNCVVDGGWGMESPYCTRTL